MKKALILFLILTGCTRQITQVVSVLKFNDQEPFGPVPAIYSEWYADTEECLGESGDFDAINWFTATEIDLDGTIALGVTHNDDITIDVRYTRARIIIRHEMAHHIVGPKREIHFNGKRRALCDGGPGQNV